VVERTLPGSDASRSMRVPGRSFPSNISLPTAAWRPAQWGSGTVCATRWTWSECSGSSDKIVLLRVRSGSPSETALLTQSSGLGPRCVADAPSGLQAGSTGIGIVNAHAAVGRWFAVPVALGSLLLGRGETSLGLRSGEEAACSALSMARSSHDIFGRGLFRRSTATSCRSTRISMSLALPERASSASQLSTRTSIR